MAEKTGVYTKTQESKQRFSSSYKRSSGNNSSGPRADIILQLQRTAGNQAVQRLIKSRALQAKLRIGHPNDMFEQEADRVAEQVMRMPDPASVPQSPVNSRPEGPSIQSIPRYPEKDIQRKEAADEEEGIVQMKQGSPLYATGSQPSAPSTVHEVLSSPGFPVDPATRAHMEPRFRHDFSRVRIHTGEAAEQSARDLNANAYTVGHDIVFGAGQFTPGTQRGRQLIAHELTHVIQQRNAAVPMLQRSLAGCMELVKKEEGLGLLSGKAVHKIIEDHFQSSVAGARRGVQIPGASANPQRTEALCGKPSRVIRPERGGSTATTAGVGLPDLARVTQGGLLQVAEIKPANLLCLIDGEIQALKYIDQGNARDPDQARWRASKGFVVVMPLSSSHYPPPTLSSPTPAGTVIIETAWCTPGLLAYSVSLKRKRSRRRVRVPVREPVRVRLPVRVRGYHPFFEDFANRLPYREALPGRDFVVALEAGLFAQQVAKGQRALELSRKRLFRVDPRGIPFIQVQPVLIGGAIVAGVVGAAVLAVLLAPAIGALIPVVVEAAAATSTAIAEIAATAATWTEVKITAAAAAGIVTYLVTGGMGKAEAEEAVKPLVGKRIVAMADITGIAEWTNPKPGQEVKIGGQTFNAIMLLTTR